MKRCATATFTATGNPTIGTRTATDVNSITARLTSDSDTSTTKMVKYASNVQISVSATAQISAYISSVTVNGSKITELTSQMMGGHGGQGGRRR